MKKRAKSKRVLITGCSSGFGLLTAVAAAEAGFEVIATMRNLQKSDRLKQALKKAGTSATIDQLDVTKAEDIEAIAAKYSPIDILVNNAGILMGGSFMSITDAESRDVFETDYFGAVAMTKALVPSMIQRKEGMIINVTSLAGRIGHMFNSAYAAAKHALIGFTRSTQLELRPFNIKVVSVEPGYHKTEVIRNNANLSENFYDNTSPMFKWNKGFLQLMFKEIIPRAGNPKKVANKIVKIMQTAHPKTHYIIGTDALLATTAQWLGLGSLLQSLVYAKLRSKAKRIKKRTRKTASNSSIVSE